MQCNNIGLRLKLIQLCIFGIEKCRRYYHTEHMCLGTFHIDLYLHHNMGNFRLHKKYSKKEGMFVLQDVNEIQEM